MNRFFHQLVISGIGNSLYEKGITGFFYWSILLHIFIRCMVAPFHFKHTLRELPGSAVEEKCPAVEETSPAVEESSHGGLFRRPATPPKIDAT